MKYGFNYYPAFKYYDEEQAEYVIFRGKNIFDFEGLAEFHEDHPSVKMRLVGAAAEILEKNIIDTALALGGIIVMTDEQYDDDVEDVIDLCRDKEVPYAFYNPITKWDVVNFILTLGVHDITVGEEIAFDIIRLSNICKKANTKLFVYCNVAQNGSVSGAITDFFVRPEDVQYYEPYVDCMLFYSQTKHTPLNVLYEIYAHDAEWPDYMNYIIEGLIDTFDNRNVITPFNFGQIRLDCRKDCAKGVPCDMCYSIKSLCDLMHEHDLVLEKSE